ncbi:non-specific lipid transfer protein GPI-anchored 30 [Rutidosis leptorrhynchoides]|uniref:non-specific lipid transfer protein GPI-anchored 30 n=1 Tax=Rutidosis leptorrhynchoides TaxID=125765 RepID=UPI003A9A45B8
MKMINSTNSMKMMIIISLVMILMGNAYAQLNNGVGSQCMNQLLPCLNYLNNQRNQQDPPNSCCEPLKSVIKSNPECLCSMISNQGTTEAEIAGINVTKAQELPARCGQRVNPISCLTTTSKSTPGTSDSQNLKVSKMYLFTLAIIAALFG